jgi:hypothetical protein
MAGIYLAMALAYSIGGLWSVLAFGYSARGQGCTLRLRAWIELAALAFVLWPLLLAQTIFATIHAYQRNRLARLRRRV